MKSFKVRSIIFEAWSKQELTRDGEVLDPDVNYFVQKLEHLGAKTFYSCGGHPDGFYIVFKCSFRLACRIANVGYFDVQIERKTSAFKYEGTRYSIRLPDRSLQKVVIKGEVIHFEARTLGEEAERNKLTVLSHAAEAWEKELK